MHKNKSSIITRRQFLKSSALGVSAIGLGVSSISASVINNENRKFLIRFDTESRQKEKMKGFFEKIVSTQREYDIPISFFCLGAAIELRESEFKEFYQEIKNDPLFDIQDHSYSHVGLGYENGKSIEDLRADYEKSFSVHERVFGRRPVGVSLCGTGGRDGRLVCGFDANEKSRAELDMLAKLGVKIVNTSLCNNDSTEEFVNYGKIGHPEIMGFPNGLSDSGWLRRSKYGEPMEFIKSQIEEKARLNKHMAIMFHDSAQWSDTNDKEFINLRTIANFAKTNGYELITHVECYNRKELWH